VLTSLVILMLFRLIPLTLSQVHLVHFLAPVESDVLLLQEMATLIHETQRERGFSGGYYSSGGNITDTYALQMQYNHTDAALERFINYIVVHSSPLLKNEVFHELMESISPVSIHSQLNSALGWDKEVEEDHHVHTPTSMYSPVNAHRLRVWNLESNANFSFFDVIDFYYNLNAQFLDCAFEVAATFHNAHDTTIPYFLGENVYSLFNSLFSTAMEYMNIERLQGLEVVNTETEIDLSVYTEFWTAAEVQEQFLSVSDRYLAVINLPMYFPNVSSVQAVVDANQFRDFFSLNMQPSELASVSERQYFDVMTDKIRSVE